MKLLELSKRLIHELDRADLSYVHWKSNLRLEEALAGETDLDLYLPMEQRERFREILRPLGFREISIEEPFRYPSMEDYLGYDSPSGRFVHLHLHYRIILGEWNLKSMVLPLGDFLLRNRILHYGVPVPEPERECIVLALRIVAKRMGWRHPRRVAFALANRLLLHRPDSDELSELRTLMIRTDSQRLARALSDASVPENVRSGIENVLMDGRFGRAEYRELARYLRQRRWLRGWELRRRWITKLVRGPRRKRLVPNSIAVAIVGSDGTGKTTVVEQIVKDFSWKLRVRREYLGFNPKQMSRIVRVLSYICLPIGLLRRLAPIRSVRLLDALRVLFFERRGLAQRTCRYNRGIRRMMAGELVIFERFPLYRVIDNPAFLLDPGALTHSRPFDPALLESGRVKAAVEELDRGYRDFPHPDLLIILRNESDYLAQRRPWLDELSREIIYRKRDRVNALLESLKDSENVEIVDTDRTIEEVVNSVKELIWQRIPG